MMHLEVGAHSFVHPDRHHLIDGPVLVGTFATWILDVTAEAVTKVLL